MEIEKIKQIFDYLYLSTDTLEIAQGGFAFSRADSLIANKISDLYKKQIIYYCLITGGIGKDSQNLADRKLSEAEYQFQLLENQSHIPKNSLLLETNATNGAENSKYGIETILQNNYPHDKLIIIAHPTSIKRLYAVHQSIAKKLNFKTSYQFAPTEYKFNPKNEIDQIEAIDELLRLVDWPKKKWGVPQEDIPENLVEYARYEKTKIN